MPLSLLFGPYSSSVRSVSSAPAGNDQSKPIPNTNGVAVNEETAGGKPVLPVILVSADDFGTDETSTELIARTLAIYCPV